jgi:dTDP-glucose pyrophosphorylase
MQEGIALIFLAAGNSTRFGRPKQLEPVGPNGESIIELSVRDAARAGFSQGIVVVKEEHLNLWKTKKWTLPVQFCVQNVANGTAGALLLGMNKAAALGFSTWAVANGDDYYGDLWSTAFELAAQGWTGSLAYPLQRVCSATGLVNRAVLHCSEDGLLFRIEERLGIAQADPMVQDNPLVSMNAWIFDQQLLDVGQNAQSGGLKGEFGIPDLIHYALNQGIKLKVRAVGTTWVGLTYAEDREAVLAYFNSRN